MDQLRGEGGEHSQSARGGLDGTFACSRAKPDADFHPVADVNDADVERLVRAIRTRVLRFLRRTGKLTDEHTVDHDGLDGSTDSPSTPPESRPSPES